MVSFSLLNAIDPTTIAFIVLLALLIVALLVVPMFTNKKRAKQTDELHRSLQPGDVVKTIGGVVGTIIEIRQVSPVDKEMIIETGVGDNKTTMVFDIQALYQVMSRSSTIVPAKDEAEVAEEEAAPEQNNEPAREVPPIVADRTSEPEVKEEPAVEKKEEVATEPAAEQSAVAEEAATEPEANDTVAEPEKAPAKVKAAAQKKPAQKSAGAKKSTANGGAKKSAK